jgi:hypothetical protein
LQQRVPPRSLQRDLQGFHQKKKSHLTSNCLKTNLTWYLNAKKQNLI